MEEHAIKNIISSVPGRRLLNCLLLVQPITIPELRQLVKLSLEVFNPRVVMNREFPDTSNIEVEQIIPQLKEAFEFDVVDKSKLSKDLFTNAELYNEKRILKKAVASDLVIEKKVNMPGGDVSYFFLNSDLQFTPDVKEGIKITNCHDSYLHKYTHERIIDSSRHPYTTENINERIALSINTDEVNARTNLFPINEFLMFLWWLIKHPKLIFKTVEEYKKITLNVKNPRGFTRKDIPKVWRSATHLIDQAIKTHLFTETETDFIVFPLIERMAEGKLFFNFCRSYEILRCFSNFEDHLSELHKKSPMELLDILTSEKYDINPSRRPLLFTSIMYYPLKFKKIHMGQNDVIEEPYNVTQIIGNDKIAPTSLVSDSEITKYCPELKRSRYILLQHFFSTKPKP